jgi:RNA polymerase sigma factor (sigma-70 family)
LEQGRSEPRGEEERGAGNEVVDLHDRTVAVDVSRFQIIFCYRRRMDEQFFERHAPAIVRFFRGLVRDDVEELVQETFVRMLEGQDRIRADTDPHAYLVGIARNVLREHLRKLVRARKIDPDVESMAVLDPGPSTIAARRREQRMLTEALRRLPVRLQVILQLHYWDKLKAKEIAAIEGISASGMRDRLMRARKLLKRQLAELERTTPLFVSTASTNAA